MHDNAVPSLEPFPGLSGMTHVRNGVEVQPDISDDEHDLPDVDLSAVGGKEEGKNSGDGCCVS